jgi:hypothetical protein
MTATLRSALGPWPVSVSNVRALIEESGYELVVTNVPGRSTTAKAVHPERPTIVKTDWEELSALIAVAEAISCDEQPAPAPREDGGFISCEDCLCCSFGQCASGGCPRNGVGDSICPCTCP